MKVMRIWFACSFGMAISMIFDWSYGFLAMIMTVFLLHIKLERNLPMALMLVFSAIYTSIEFTYVVEVFQAHPLILTGVVAILMLIKCIAMMHPMTYLFGFGGLLIGSMILNFASYDFFDMADFNVNLWVNCLGGLAIYLLSHLLFPEPPDSEPQPAPPPKTEQDKIIQVASGWIIVMSLFVIFQTFDLFDSLSALISVIIILVPFTLVGVVGMGKVRVIGTALGCLAGLMLQIVLGKWFSNPMLFWLGFTIAVGLISKLFGKGMIQAGIAFSAIAALSVPLTTALVPEQRDATFALLYRFSSIFVAVLATTLIMYITSQVLTKVLTKPAAQQ